MTGKSRIRTFNSRSYIGFVYVILWLMVWTYPAVTALIVAVRMGAAVSWDGVLHAWECILPFFLLFLIHRLPVHYLFMRHRVSVYVLSVVVMLCLFGIYRYCSDMKMSHAPSDPEYRVPPHEPPREKNIAIYRDDKGRKRDSSEVSSRLSSSPHLRPAKTGPFPGSMFSPLLVDLIIATLMLGFDLAIALFSRYQEEQEKARRLEAAHLRHELEYLKAQVNPHFFMNMLNNIHGMVEMNPAKAQVMIMELSKLMRYVLYEGAKNRTYLYKETDFITSYVELMRKRYSSRKVHISLELPDRHKEYILLPPLLFIGIIENAFKHGISYQSPSFVKIRLYIEKEMLCLDCVNSIHRHPHKKDYAGGMGLANLRQRLQLLYGDGFMLDITEKDGKTYHVNLRIPCEYDTDTMHRR